MGSNKYKYNQMTRFDGGINGETERAKQDEVRDALNFWTPESRVVRRPGVTSRQVLDPSLIPSTNPLFAQTPNTALYTAGISVQTGSTVTPVMVNTTSVIVGTVPAGSSLNIPIQSSTPINVSQFGLEFWVDTASYVAPAFTSLEVLTARGWVGVENLQYAYGTRSIRLYDTNFVSVAVSQIIFSSPRDALTTAADIANYIPGFTSAQPYNFVIRLRAITAMASNTGFAYRTYDSGAPLSCVYRLYTGSTNNVASVGIFKAQYATGSKTIGVGLGANSNATYIVGPVNYPIPPYAIYSERDNLRWEPRYVPYGAGTRDNYGVYSYLYTNSFTQWLPPTFTVVPEFNTAFSAYQNVVVEHPYVPPFVDTLGFPSYGQVTPDPYYRTPPPPITYQGGLGGPNYSKANIARVNSDPTMVGTAAQNSGFQPDFSVDAVALDSAFPAANYIIYFKNRLWCAGIKDQPNTIQWGGPTVSAGSGGYALNVWPSAQQTYLSSAQDNTPITGIAALADNLVVFKKNSIWQMIDTGDSVDGLATYDARLVVAGVGCVGHGSIQQVNGGLIFLGEDGFYFYDGTPNVRRISDNIKEYIGRINSGRESQVTSVYWRSRYHYMCAVSLDSESSSNNYVFVYDVQGDAWWVWSGWDVQCWYQDDGVGQVEDIWFLDRYGRANKLGWGDTDNGTHIDTMLLTQRFGEGEYTTKALCEVRVEGFNNNGPVTFDVITDDYPAITNRPIIMPLTDETRWVPNPYPGSLLVSPKRRERKHSVRVVAKWFQLKVKNALRVLGVGVGFNVEGRR